MEEIESLVITRYSEGSWTYNVDGLVGSEDAYTGGIVTGTGLLTIKALNGAPQVLNVPYTVISYVDNTDGTRSRASFDSVVEAFVYLNDEGFFVGSATSGGGGGATVLFKNLPDVNVPTFLGRNGQFVYVNGSMLDTTANPAGNLRIQDLQNYVGSPVLSPNMTFVTQSSFLEGGEPGFTQASLVNIINRPARYNEPSVWRKGFTIVDNEVVWNLEDYALEVGDITVPIWSDLTGATVPKLVFGQYMGGDPLDPANINWVHRWDFGETLL